MARQMRVLMAVIHDDRLGARGHRRACSGDAVSGDPSWRGAGEQEGLIADLIRAVTGLIDARRPRQRAAITPGQAMGARAARRE